MLIATAIGLISVPLFGYLSDLIGRRLMYGIACIELFAFPYYGLLNTKTTGLILLAIVLSLVFHDMQYGPQAALIAESFGPATRYSGAGLGYQLASVIAGGPAPLVAAAILGAAARTAAAPSEFDEAVERGAISEAQPEIAGHRTDGVRS